MTVPREKPPSLKEESFSDAIGSEPQTNGRMLSPRTSRADANGGLSPKVSRMDPNLVWFKSGDRDNPYNYSLRRKCLIVGFMCMINLWIVTISAIYAPANNVIAERYGVSPLVARIGQATFLVGFSFGPVCITPLSEDYGRKWVLGLSLCVCYLFVVACAVAPNYETLVICRFFGGFFSSPLFNACALVPDLFLPEDVKGSWAINCWCLSGEVFILLAPVAGAYITESQGFQWIFWWSVIVGFALQVPYFLFIPETRGGVILVRRAKRLREETGNTQLFAEHEIVGHRPWKQIVQETLIRPVKMLFTEPVVFWFALLDGYNYGIYFVALNAIPVVYAEHGLAEPSVNFVFATLAIGGCIGVALFYFQLKAQARLDAKHGGQSIPEGKLLWCMPAAILFPISLFLFAWLSFPRFHWMASAIWFVPFGVVGHVIFVAVSDYTLEAYGSMASSAITGQSFARELSSAGLAIVGVNFFEDLGTRVAGTILGAIAAGLCFVPFVFFRYGHRIRARSAYSLQIKEAADQERRMRKEEELARMEARDGT